MSGIISKQIVTDSLILYLDAANINSYVPIAGSTSATWVDISKLNTSSTIGNSPIYTSEYGGGLIFNGIDTYVLIGTDQNYYFNLTKPYTISVWFKLKTFQITGLVNRYNKNVVGNYFVKIGYNTIMYNREVSPFNLFSNSIFNLDVVYNSTVVYDGTRQKIYINGVLESQQLSGNIAQNQSNINLYIGCSQTSGNRSEFFNGTIYNVKIYNKGLSADEVLKNYNALKNRFVIL